MLLIGDYSEAPHHGADRTLQVMDFDSKAAKPAAIPSGERTREEVLRDIKVAIAQERNYGRETRSRGFNPYENSLGAPQRSDVWGSKRRPT